MLKNNKISGFTLVELAIVMVVIGLLVTIVAAGKNMVEAGKVRAVLQEVESLQSAFVRFHEKYADMPGDMQDGWNYWGAGCAPNANDCNGDGDEQVVWNGPAPAGTYHEGAMAFRHLQISEMLGGDPVLGHTGKAQLGVNMPGSKIANAGWAVDWNNIITSSNALQLGGANPNPLIFLSDTPIISPKNAFSIDDKLDDGLATTGRIRSEENGGNCRNGGNNYSIQNPKKDCYMRFMLDTAQ